MNRLSSCISTHGASKQEEPEDEEGDADDDEEDRDDGDLEEADSEGVLDESSMLPHCSKIQLFAHMQAHFRCFQKC